MTDDEIVGRTAARVKALMEGEGSGHDWWHVYRVWRNAVHIAQHEPVDLVVVELAALLHDIADWKFHGGDRSAGPRAARSWLTELGVDEAVVAHVCEIVGDLSFKGAAVPTPMRTREGMVVQDADRLDAIGAIGIARAFAYGGYRGRTLYEPDVTPQLHNSAADYLASGTHTINHFYEKLLLLKDRMNTDAARTIAAERHAVMETFLTRFYAEWDGEA